MARELPVIRCSLADVTGMGHPACMGFPPPPHNGPPPPPDEGGGFGPPQGFGPPPPPPPPGGGTYGYPQQGGADPYGHPQQGADPYGHPQQGADPYGHPQQGADPYGHPQQGAGYGQPGPPGPPVPPGGFGYPPGGPGGYPPPPPNNTKRNGWIAVGVVVVIGAIIAGVVVAGGKDGTNDDAKPKTPVSTVPALPTDLPTPGITLPSDIPTDPTGDPDATADPAPSEKLVPYVVLAAGQCFDAPTLSPSVTKVTTRSCSSPHDAQVVANETLSGTFTSDREIQQKALDLCTADAKKHLPADGQYYYPYVLYPKLVTYQLQNRRTVTCSLTKNNGTTGKKLYSKLG
jgi:hypothetical protein